MSDIKIKHPTHVCASTDEDGGNRRWPLYLERNDRDNWVEFCRRPGEWDVETGKTLGESSWNFYLVDVRKIAPEELVEYWQGVQAEAEILFKRPLFFIRSLNLAL